VTLLSVNKIDEAPCLDPGHRAYLILHCIRLLERVARAATFDWILAQVRRDPDVRIRHCRRSQFNPASTAKTFCILADFNLGNADNRLRNDCSDRFRTARTAMDCSSTLYTQPVGHFHSDPDLCPKESPEKNPVNVTKV
jgi:hypothetical protein